MNKGKRKRVRSKSTNTRGTCPKKPKNDIPVYPGEPTRQLQIANRNYGVYNVPGDGNCFFHCLSYVMNGNVTNHGFYRALICQYVYDEWDQMRSLVSLSHDLPTLTPEAYWQALLQRNGYAGRCEIQAAATVLNCNFTVWLQGSRLNKTNGREEVTYHQDTINNSNKTTSTINLLLKNQHYSLLGKVEEQETPLQQPEPEPSREPEHHGTSPTIDTPNPKKTKQSRGKPRYRDDVEDKTPRETERATRLQRKPRTRKTKDAGPGPTLTETTCESETQPPRQRNTRTGKAHHQDVGPGPEPEIHETSHPEPESKKTLRGRSRYREDAPVEDTSSLLTEDAPVEDTSSLLTEDAPHMNPQQNASGREQPRGRPRNRHHVEDETSRERATRLQRESGHKRPKAQKAPKPTAQKAPTPTAQKAPTAAQEKAKEQAKELGVNDIPVYPGEPTRQLQIANRNYGVYNVPGDGNCFFHCLSYAMNGNLTNHGFYRALICQYVYNEWDQMRSLVSISHDLPTLTPEAYWQALLQRNGYAGRCEIQAAATVLNCNFTVWLQGSRLNKINGSEEVTYHQDIINNSNTTTSTINLLLKNQHYSLLGKVEEQETPLQQPEPEPSREHEHHGTSPIIDTPKPKQKQQSRGKPRYRDDVEDKTPRETERTTRLQRKPRTRKIKDAGPGPTLTKTTCECATQSPRQRNTRTGKAHHQDVGPGPEPEIHETSQPEPEPKKTSRGRPRYREDAPVEDTSSLLTEDAPVEDTSSLLTEDAPHTNPQQNAGGREQPRGRPRNRHHVQDGTSRERATGLRRESRHKRPKAQKAPTAAQEKAKELGVAWDPSNENETQKERCVRLHRNNRRIASAKKKLSSNLPEAPQPQASTEENRFTAAMESIKKFEKVQDETSRERATGLRRESRHKRPKAQKAPTAAQEKAKELGVAWDPPNENETQKERCVRLHINNRRIASAKTKLSSNLPEAPQPQASTEENRFTAAMESIKKFEKEQMNYKFSTCTTCQERRLEMKMGTDTICRRCLKDKDQVKMFSAENNMDPGSVPPALADLTIIEQQLICRISPAINVHMLKHGGIGANGHCVTFPQEVDEVGQIFPRLPEEVNLIKIRKQGKNDTTKDFKVRRYTVQAALIWLKTNNRAYSDIIISQERLNNLPECGEIAIHTVEVKDTDHLINDQGPAQEQYDPGETEDGTSASGVLLQDPPRDIRQSVENVVNNLIGRKEGQVTSNRRGNITIPWPTRGKDPLSEFTTRNFFTLAFPCLFPHGTGDFNINRCRTCKSLSDWAEHLLWYKDGRFSRHRYFKFIIHNMITRKRALENSTYIMKQQLGDEHLTVQDLKEKLEAGDQSIANKILYFSASLRGTSQYWAQRAKELRALIQYQINEGKGLPSFFTTGSCAEYHFKPLRRLLEFYLKDTTGVDVNLDDRNKLFGALQENAHIIGHYFDLRTQSYFHQVMRPVFGVESFWYRQEFAKSRGMIHWHGLCWMKDRQPHNLLYEAIQKGLLEDQKVEDLSNWAKQVFGMTATHPAGKDQHGESRKDLWPPPEGTAPAPPEEKNPLVKLLMDVSESQESLLEDHILLSNRITIHRCSDYCLRQKKGNGSGKTCRMEFGTPEAPGKELRSIPAIVRDKNNSLRLEMERDHPMLVQHSRFHTQGWRANGDVSIILSQSNPDNPSVDEIIAVERYVCGYACKGCEGTGATVDLFNDMVNSTSDGDTTAKSLCSRLLTRTVRRDVSAVEACYELSGLPLYRSSHTFQSISVTGARLIDTSGCQLTKCTALDKYRSRPENEIGSWFNFICRGGRVPVIAGSAIRANWPLTEDYCRMTLLLHWSNWREIKDIKDAKMSWVERMTTFLEMDNCPNFIKADIERAKRDAQQKDKSPLEDDQQSQNNEQESDVEENPDWMDLVQPNADFSTESDDFAFDDGGPDHDWSAASRDYPRDFGVHWLEHLNENATEDDAHLQIPDVELESLNKEQTFAFNLVMSTLFEYDESPSNTTPLRLIVGGTAGSGKSYLIKCLVKGIRTLFGRNRAVQVLGPTGSSANLISGKTVHSFLKVPTNNKANKEMTGAEGATGQALQDNCEGLVALIVDERSLVGANTLGWMEHQCSCGIKGSNSSWGGLPVVVFLGDDVQLPPVCDTPVYSIRRKTNKVMTPAQMHGTLVWNDFTSAVILKTVIRQANTQTRFKNILQAVRTYSTSEEQAQWLQKYQWDILKTSHGQGLLDRMVQHGLFVFPTHAEENIHNMNQLLEKNKSFPVAKLRAVSTGHHSSFPSAKAGGLMPMLHLCKGAKVMLTGNINVDVGLFNGSMGTVHDIIYLDGRNPSSHGLPDVVMVEFTKYTGPSFIASTQIVPIVPIERRIDCPCNGCKRKQIPLRLGWGTTIHRCQGMTIGAQEANRYIVINPGPSSFESRNPGALFVALSRAKSAGDESSDPDFAWHPHVIINEDRLCHVVKTPTTDGRAKEIERINQLAKDTTMKNNSLQTNTMYIEAIPRLADHSSSSTQGSTEE